ncbi:MAG: GLPGLI family protein [Bacteroidales bacterium]|nr:GLPGLI family protein [Bacteroidales bacterium]MBQ9398931.1 GLPGLI family protein [Bacteroidales bacterium]
MRRLSAFLSFLLLLSFTSQGQNLRCGYKFWSKKDPAGKFSLVSDMRLDCIGGKSAWYSERDLVRDSLHFIAFDDAGKIADQDAYGILTRTRASGLFSATTIEWDKLSFEQHYQSAYVFLNGAGELSLPEWALSDEQKEIEGYLCRKATACYLGREWTVWYAEDIPLQNGPWLLWGAPGLILEARDADDLFVFLFTGAEPLADGHRFDLLRAYYSSPRSRKKVNNYTNDTFRNVELTYTKMRTDVDFFDQTHGTKGARLLDVNGQEMDRAAFYRFIPLVPSEYWKTVK